MDEEVLLKVEKRMWTDQAPRVCALVGFECTKEQQECPVQVHKDGSVCACVCAHECMDLGRNRAVSPREVTSDKWTSIVDVWRPEQTEDPHAGYLNAEHFG